MARLLGVLAAICAGVALNLSVRGEYPQAIWLYGIAVALWFAGRTVADDSRERGEL